MAGISREAVRKRRKKEPDFAADFDQAQREATDALEAEARRRAVDGVDEPVFIAPAPLRNT